MSLGLILRGIEGWRENRRDPVRLEEIKGGATIGASLEGRAITAYRLGNGPKHVLLFAGIHGNEIGSIRCAVNVIREWKSFDAASTSLLVIPCLNPDGFTAACREPDYLRGGRTGRLNARSVDLNRNFPVPSFQTQSVWNHGKSYGEQQTVFAGEAPGSEPETRLLMQLVAEEKPTLVISLHTAGADVTGGATPPSQVLARKAADASGYRFFPEQEWLELKQTGTAKEWFDRKQVPYIELELSRRWGADWQRSKPALQALWAEEA